MSTLPERISVLAGGGEAAEHIGFQRFQGAAVGSLPVADGAGIDQPIGLEEALRIPLVRLRADVCRESVKTFFIRNLRQLLFAFMIPLLQRKRNRFSSLLYILFLTAVLLTGNCSLVIMNKKQKKRLDRYV